jgi:hypothetical protein
VICRLQYPQIVKSVGVDNSNGDGIDVLRELISREAATLPLMGSRWPAAWETGVHAITGVERQYAPPELLRERLTEAGVIDAAHQTYILRALHLFGDILYFDQDDELADIVILRPQWVNDFIAKVLDSPVVAAEHGLLSRRHEQELWASLDGGMRDRLLRLMEKFDLSYRIPDDPAAASLVVERLPWESPPFQERWAAALASPGASEIRLRYQLNSLPPGIPTWFIAREHRFTTGMHWRTGALLSYDGGPQSPLGLIRAERQDKTVDLAVRGSFPQLFFSVLQDGFESTLRRYQGLEITRSVPCRCQRQSEQPCAYLFLYEPLLHRLEEGVSDAECQLTFRKVSVAQLLSGVAPTPPDQIVRRLDTIDQKLAHAAAEAAWAHREILKALRRAQSRAEAVCPSVFTLIPAQKKIRKPGFRRFELRLYCEQAGTLHGLPIPPYIIEQPAEWLVKVTLYLRVLLMVLKNAVPLAGPVLGVAADELAQRLSTETDLMTAIVGELPASPVDAGPADIGELLQGAELDADYRLLYSLLDSLDPSHAWAGLSRVTSPEDDILWLCREHAKPYLS